MKPKKFLHCDTRVKKVTYPTQKRELSYLQRNFQIKLLKKFEWKYSAKHVGTYFTLIYISPRISIFSLSSKVKIESVKKNKYKMCEFVKIKIFI